MSIALSHIVLLFMTTGVPPAGDPAQEKIYTVSEVSIKPEPAMGSKEFHDRWSKSVKYPPEALKQKVQGIVFIEFIVNADGSVVESKVRRGIGSGCDEAALKGFDELSADGWKAGIKLGQPVRVKMVLPFYFRIIEN